MRRSAETPMPFHIDRTFKLKRQSYDSMTERDDNFLSVIGRLFGRKSD
jgi:hypothetical protein